MWSKVDTASENVGGFVKPLRVNRGVEALNMIPTRLFVGVGLVIVAKVNVDYVIRNKCLLDDPWDGGLCVTLREVVGDGCDIYAEFRRVANASVAGDANL